MEHALPLEPLPYARIDPRRVRRAMRTAESAAREEMLSSLETLLAERIEELLITPTRILELGRCPGPFAGVLQGRHPKARVVSFGLTPPIGPTVSRLRLPWKNHPALVTGDPLMLPFPRDHFDLVLSNMMLHWSADPMTALREMRRVLKPGGALLLSTAGEGTLQELKTVLAEVDRQRHGRAWIRVPEFASLHRLGEMLTGAGFSQSVADRDLFHATQPDALTLIRALRRMGAANPHRQRPPGLMGKGYPDLLAATYRHHFGLQDGSIPVTVEILFGHAWKSHPGTTSESRK